MLANSKQMKHVVSIFQTWVWRVAVAVRELLNLARSTGGLNKLTFTRSTARRGCDLPHTDLRMLHVWEGLKHQHSSMLRMLCQGDAEGTVHTCSFKENVGCCLLLN